MKQFVILGRGQKKLCVFTEEVLFDLGLEEVVGSWQRLFVPTKYACAPQLFSASFAFRLEPYDWFWPMDFEWK